MFALTERCRSEGSWVTMPMRLRSESWVTARMSWPSMRMAPPSVSKKRKARLTRVDLPAPERPTRPTFSPGRMVRETSRRPPEPRP